MKHFKCYFHFWGSFDRLLVTADTGFERSCGNVSIAMKNNKDDPKRVGCYWMHEVHISADVALYFRLNYYRSGQV